MLGGANMPTCPRSAATATPCGSETTVKHRVLGIKHQHGGGKIGHSIARRSSERSLDAQVNWRFIHSTSRITMARTEGSHTE
jgi:hypothetical protein